MNTGDELADLVRTIELPDMVAYGAATWDWHRLHYDAEYATSIGLDGPAVDGQMIGALIAEHAQDELGPTARIRRLTYRNRNVVRPGDTVRCTGRIVSVSDETTVVIDHEVRVGDRVVATGQVSCVINKPLPG